VWPAPKESKHAAPQKGQRASVRRMWRAQEGQARRRAVIRAAYDPGWVRAREAVTSLGGDEDASSSSAQNETTMPEDDWRPAFTR
jgi:hypothetical protein